MRAAAIIATYNRADTLSRAIDSAIRQDHGELDVIVVDDGSTDHTPAVLTSYGDTITAIRQDNAERGAARNRGAAAAGDVDVLLFLDSDDQWRPHAVSTLLRGFADRRIGVSYGYARFVDADDREVGRSPGRPSSGDVFRRLVASNFLTLSATAIRRELFVGLGGFVEDRVLCSGGGEDWDLWFRAAANAPFAFVPEVVVDYHVHPGQTVADVDRHLDGVKLAAERIAAHPRTRREGLQPHASAAPAIRRARLLREQDRPSSALRGLLQAGMSEPAVLRVPELWRQVAAASRDVLRPGTQR